MSVLSFIAQLDELLDNLAAVEASVVAKLAPGPNGWMTAGCMKQLNSFGHSFELSDMRYVATAAKARVHKFENARHGGEVQPPAAGAGGPGQSG